MDGDLLRDTLSRAREQLADDLLRTRHGFETSNFNFPPLNFNFEDFEEHGDQANYLELAGGGETQLWDYLPHLSDIPSSLLKKLPVTALFQLNAARAKESKAAEKLSASAKLTANAKRLALSPTWVAGSKDDRKTILHPARFLSGPSCSAQYLWLQAREIVGTAGSIALGNYDMDSFGCGGCVTPKGWLELHNPSSTDLKLKLFHLPNVASSSLSSKKINLEDNETAVSIGDSLKEISDFEGFRSALNTLREAMQWALPWNRSISAIIGFMQNTNYCTEDLKGVANRAIVLTEFVDFVLGRNALNWDNKVPFLSTEELAHTWSAWKGKRSVFFTAARSGDKPKMQHRREKKDDICRKYQTNSCTSKPEDCKSFYGMKLRHVCAWVLPNTGGKKCEKDHPKAEHK